jgi:hypothetical protein
MLPMNTADKGNSHPYSYDLPDFSAHGANDNLPETTVELQAEHGAPTDAEKPCR